jgi:hypothetical protein
MQTKAWIPGSRPSPVMAIKTKTKNNVCKLPVRHFALFKQDMTENAACFPHPLASFQDRKAATSPSSRVPASAMPAMFLLLVVVTYEVRI